MKRAIVKSALSVILLVFLMLTTSCSKANEQVDNLATPENEPNIATPSALRESSTLPPIVSPVVESVKPTLKPTPRTNTPEVLPESLPASSEKAIPVLFHYLASSHYDYLDQYEYPLNSEVLGGYHEGEWKDWEKFSFGKPGKPK